VLVENDRFYRPFGVAVDSLGFVFVADNGHSLLRMIDSNGVVTRLAGAVDPDPSGPLTDGTGTNANFISLGGLTTDSQRNIYAADAYTIRKITTAGVVTSYEAPNHAYSFQSIAFGTDGTLFATDSGSSVIVAVDLATITFTIIAGDTSFEYR
jgi:sugar lactone lactonase YvrE